MFIKALVPSPMSAKSIGKTMSLRHKRAQLLVEKQKHDQSMGQRTRTEINSGSFLAGVPRRCPGKGWFHQPMMTGETGLFPHVEKMK